MNVSLGTYIVRFIILMVIQMVVLHNALTGLTLGRYMSLFIYIAFVLLLPVRIRPVVLLMICFILGLVVDLFYHTPGVNASALVLMGFARIYVLKFMEPREKYDQLSKPSFSRYGFRWFLTYTFVLASIYCFSYSILESFTISNLHITLLRGLISALASTAIIVLYQNIAVRD